MPEETIKIGQISYLNIWPIFYYLKELPYKDKIRYIPGHPSWLNRILQKKELDLSPSSSFEYLAFAEQYKLLPNLSISAKKEVQSVIFCSPVTLKDLPVYLQKEKEVFLTQASATSVALLKVLWSFAWRLPQPQWRTISPGTGLHTGKPFLEIGDKALEIYLNPPPGWVIIDLARAWYEFTNLPFVFAVWIVNQDLSKEQKRIVDLLCEELAAIKQKISSNLRQLASFYPKQNFSEEQIVNYWLLMDYDLEPPHMASLALFGQYLTRLGMISGTPVLNWMS